MDKKVKAATEILTGFLLGAAGLALVTGIGHVVYYLALFVGKLVYPE